MTGPAQRRGDAGPGAVYAGRCARIAWQPDGQPILRPEFQPPARPRDPARLVPRRRRRRPVDPAVRELLDGSLVTPAGRFFGPPWSSPGRLPLAPPAMFLVHLGTAADGFLANGRIVPPGLLARVIGACPEWRHRPVLLLPHPHPGGDRLRPLVRTLTEQLRVPVYTADTGVWQLSGTAFTGGAFQRWPVVTGAEGVLGEPATVGSFLPRPETVAARGDRRAQGFASQERAHGLNWGTHIAGPPPTGHDQPWPENVPSASPPPTAPQPAPQPQPVPVPVLDPVVLPVPAVTGLTTMTEPLPETVRRAAPVVQDWSASHVDPAPGTARIAPAPDQDPEASRPRPAGGAVPVGGAVPLGGAAPLGGAWPVPASSSVDAGRPNAGRFGTEPAAPGLGLPWVAVRSGAEPADRERLRALLGWRYETHSRAVLSTLSLQPGLRSGTSTVDVLAGLVAVRAYLSAAVPAVPADGLAGSVDAGPRPAADQRAATAGAVNAALRAAERGPDADGLLTLARCMCAGLGRLPAVVGPVFRPALVEPEAIRRYRPGAMLVEPAFLEVSVTPWESAGANVCYAIWSSTARRTDRLGLRSPEQDGAGGRALFAAGTRFVVLDVVPGDQAGTGEAPTAGAQRPVWVLLREALGGRADAALDERAGSRLRDVVTNLAGRAAAPPLAGFGPAIGIGSGARAFALDGGRPVGEPAPVMPPRPGEAPSGT